MKGLKSSLFALGAALIMPLAAHADPVVLATNQIQPISLEVPAGSIIVGDSSVADIIVQNRRLLLLTGRSFGTTQVSVLDREGNVLFANEVIVQDNSANRLVITRAGTPEEYTCAPNCRKGDTGAPSAAGLAAAPRGGGGFRPPLGGGGDTLDLSDALAASVTAKAATSSSSEN